MCVVGIVVHAVGFVVRVLYDNFSVVVWWELRCGGGMVLVWWKL